MFNRLATDGLVPQQPASEAPLGWEGSEETTERLAHLEQLVVQLKELVCDKDTQLAHKDTQLQNEKDTAEVRFTKLKLQAKAKMASLNKQIHELKGQEGPASPDTSFTGGQGPELQEELHTLRTRLEEEEASRRDLLQRLQATQHLLQEKEVDHTEQLRVLQAVVCEKDARFQAQIQRQEEELLRVASQSQADPDLQQKQILTAQFRQMDQELAESGRKMEEERQQWTLELWGAQKELEALRSNMEAWEREKVELEALRSNMEAWEREMVELEALRSNMAELEALRSNMAELEALRSNMEAWEREKVELETLRSNMEAWEKEKVELEALRSNVAELEALRANMEAWEREKVELDILRSNMEAWEREKVELEALKSNMEAWEREKVELDALRSNMAELEYLRSNMVAWESDKAEVSRLDSELASLREAEYWALNASQEALEEQKKEVARLESELAEVKALQGSCAAAESNQADVAQVQGELTGVPDSQESSTERTVVETERLKELRAVEEESQRKGELLAELWQGLCSLVPEGGHEAVEEGSAPSDPALVLGRLEALGAQVTTLKEEWERSEEKCHQLAHTVETLQEQLDANTSEQEEATIKTRQLDEETGSMSAESPVQHVTEPSELDSSEPDKAHILSLEHQLLEKDSELASLRESLALAQVQTPSVAAAESCGQIEEQDGAAATATPGDSVVADPDLLEESPEEDTTLVAEDNSILSGSADNGSSPELIQPQSDSPGESKGASSDEMVTSTDSEVAHSSWTLLDAVNQDGSQEWPSILQDFGQSQMQSWDETSVEQETTTVRVESSSIVIHEMAQAQLSQQGGSPTHPALSSGQVFVQAPAEELQRRYSELLVELQRLRETSTDSHERILSLEEERNVLVTAKEEAEAQARNFEEGLQSAREELDKFTQQGTVVKNNVEMSLLEEQITILKAESETKEHEIRNLQKRKLQDMESSLLEFSQSTDINNSSLVEKDSEINELQLRLTQKEQEMSEVFDGMSVKLLQSECETLHKKLLDAQESRKETIRKAKEKDRHHREQLKQHKEEYNDLMGRFEGQSEMEISLEKLREECQASQMARSELAEKLQVTKTALSQKEIELKDLGKELEGFREREKQADVLSEEIQILREKFTQAESYAETIKLEMEATAKVASESSVTNLQAEVEEFKLFLVNKNQEIEELSQQLGEQNSLLRIIQTTVSQKEQLILSLQEDLKAEQEKTMRLENEVLPKQQEDDKDSEAKVQQLQRKLQAALISRKDVLKENKTQKEKLATNEKVVAKLKENMEAKVAELEKLRAERGKLIEEVDRTLVENQSLGSSCESLKLAMEGILSEKDACQREVKFAQEEAARTCRDLQEKIQSMKEEYETLLKSYENVSDEAERVRRVLEAARQERQELAAKIRTHEVSRQDAEKQVEEARKEVDLVKDKMRKFAKTKQHKILDLEEENEKLREIEERKGGKKDDSVKDKIRDLETLLGTEREQKQELGDTLTSLEQQLEEFREKVQSLTASLQQSLQEVQEKERIIVEESARKEAQLKELRRSLEAEKDDLEERLMNQLARLNGSIAGYQQEVGDTRERLADLQREVERLERERAELEAQAQSEMDRAARLEEDKRQAQRERAEAEAESGKQRELEQQLRSAQRVREGSQNRARQLEELLREKQMEMRQLQNDSIKYQERISELGRETKALQLGRQELQKQLDQSNLESSKTLQQLKSNEAELVQYKSQLDEAQKTATEALAEKVASEQAALQREDMIKLEAEQTLDAVRFRLGAELKEIELKLEEAYRERVKEEAATLNAREVATEARRQAQEMQAHLDESLARLAAFSRCMSSLQNDRDRVIDEVRQWETRFSDTLQGKESEVRQGEAQAKELSEQLQKEISLKEELHLSVERLEKINTEQQLRLEEDDKKICEAKATLELERERLQKALVQLQSAQAEARALGSEVEGLSHGKQALEEAVERLQGEVELAREALVQREAEERRLCLHVEQLETDLRSSKILLESLQRELSEKERREMELLGEKEQAVAQAAEEAKLDERLRKTEEDGNLSKARLDSFMKAMGSLQDDRDNILISYKRLEEKHLQVMMEKDGLIQEAAGENNGLKEELRSLLAQRDDLYAERAKLASQLHNYREELNQVLTLKESQHKQAQAGQRQRIASLEMQQQELEAQVRSLAEVRETKEDAVERETLSRSSDPDGTGPLRDAPGAEVEKLREQLQAAMEQVEALEESLHEETREKEARAKELAQLRWGDGVMRTESENAQERVAELARDLLMVEQRLLEEKEASTRLRAENKAFGKAMASLQDSREEVEAKAHELGLRLEEVHRAGEGQTTPSSPSVGGGGATTGEVWSLKNALQALQNDRERLLEQMQKQGAELQRHKAELVRLGAGELIKVSQELTEERTRAEDLLGVVKQLEDTLVTGKQEVEVLRLERVDWLSQVEQREQQTFAVLAHRDQQLSQMGAMLEEARAASKPR
ncbi:hypothetical protein NHX12_020253, partial [Muraenolepis orangiensis]